MTMIDQRGQQVGIQYNIVNTLSGKRIPLFKPPQVPNFTNREAELEKLLDDLRPGNVITFCGPGGIGKTALTAEAIWTIAPEDDSPKHFPDGIIFHTFYNQPSVDVALETIARALGEEAKPTPMAGAQRALSGRKVLLVLDGTEKADDLSKIYTIAGDCGVIVTSRSSDDAVEDWHDMTPLPTDESVKLLQAWGQDRADDQESVKKICELIGNLPLAVRLAGRYLSHRKMAASHYLEWLKASPLTALHHGERSQQSVPILLEQSLRQVGEEAKITLALVGRLALSPFSSVVISEALGVPVYEAEDRLGQLVNWGLLNASNDRYQVTHALIHTYAHERLELDDNIMHRLLTYHLTLIQTESNQGVQGYRRLDQERQHLLSLVGLCLEKGIWQSAKQLVWSLTVYLNLQGYKTEWINVLEMGITAARQLQDRQSEGEFISDLGIAYSDLGQVEKAIKYHKQALAISREVGYRQGEGSQLGNLGTAYHALRQVEKAIEYYEQALAISREVGHQQGEGSHLGNLGIAYHALGQVEKAIEYYEQALAISREIGRREGEGSQLGSLGNAYHDLGQVEKAIKYHKQALAISREIGHQQGEGSQLGSLGNAYHALGQVEKAIEYHKQALAISREVGDRKNEGSHLGNLGIAYHDLSQVKKAIEYYEQALAISREIGDRQGEGIQLGSLGNAYHDLGQVEKAIEYYEQALAISREIGDRQGEGIQLGNLGIAYRDLGQVEKAKQCFQDALLIFEEIKSPTAGQVRRWLEDLE